MQEVTLTFHFCEFLGNGKNKVEITNNILRMLSYLFPQSNRALLFCSWQLAARVHKQSALNENQMQSREDHKRPHNSNHDPNGWRDSIRTRFQTREVV